LSDYHLLFFTTSATRRPAPRLKLPQEVFFTLSLLGKVNIFLSIPTIFTNSVLPSFRKVGTSVCCVTSSPELSRAHSLRIWFLLVSTDTAVWLTSLHSSRQTSLPLAWLRDVTPALRGLSPVGTTIFLVYIHHSRHIQGFCKKAVSVLN